MMIIAFCMKWYIIINYYNKNKIITISICPAPAPANGV